MGGVELWSEVCAVGSVMSLGVVAGLGGGADVLGNAGSYVERSTLVWGGGPSRSSWSSEGWSDQEVDMCFEALGS